MTFAIYALACLAFYAAFVATGLVTRARTLLDEFRAAMAIMGDKGLSDLEKEQRIRKASISALGGTLSLTARLVAVVAAAAVPVLLAHLLAGLRLEEFTRFSLNPAVLVATVALLGGLDWYRRSRMG